MISAAVVSLKRSALFDQMICFFIAGGLSSIVYVPAGCALQDLSLVAPPSDAVAGLSGQVDHVRLAPR